MQWTGSEMLDRLHVLLRAVTLVPRKTVIGVDPVHPFHQLVTKNFRNDRRRANCRNTRVTADDGRRIDLLTVEYEIGQSVAVNLYECRTNPQAEYGPPHCQVGRLENIDGIDFRGICPGYRPCKGIRAQFIGQRLAPGLRERFRILDSRDWSSRIEDHGGGNDGAGQRSAANFVDPCDKSPCFVEQRLLHVRTIAR